MKSFERTEGIREELNIYKKRLEAPMAAGDIV